MALYTLFAGEKACSIYGAGEYWNVEQKQVRGVVELEPDTQVRIIRRGIIRFAIECFVINFSQKYL